MEMECKSCKWGKRVDYYIECHKDFPQLQVEDSHTLPLWPVMEDDDFCCYFEPRCVTQVAE